MNCISEVNAALVVKINAGTHVRFDPTGMERADDHHHNYESVLRHLMPQRAPSSTNGTYNCQSDLICLSVSHDSSCESSRHVLSLSRVTPLMKDRRILVRSSVHRLLLVA